MIASASTVALVLLVALQGPPPPASVPAEEEEVLEHVVESWTGDLDGMTERGFVRILTVHNPLYFTFDGMGEKGIAPEFRRLFEDHLAKEIGRVRSPSVVLVPVARDELISGLLEGRGDVVMGNLTITPEREALVDFSEPLYSGVDELVVTGPAAPPIATFDDLVGTGLYLRHSSSYFEHMKERNTQREAQGLAPIPLHEMDEYLEDYDLLDLVNAGILPAVVVDSHKAYFWEQVFPELVVRQDLVVYPNNQIAWAVRKGSPKLRESVDRFTRTIKKGTLLGNMVVKQYMGDTQWVKNALATEDRRRYEDTVEIIRRYADQYEFDWLMVAAQAYQESGFDQTKRSAAGAVGIMQVLPTTAADPAVGIPDISTAENNVHAGVRYLRWLRDNYCSDPAIPDLDRVLFSFAAYNAGPGNLNKARKRAEKLGLDPNRWFGNVEIGMYRAVSGEPASYVRNIYKYYVTYRGLEEARVRREKALDDGD